MKGALKFVLLFVVACILSFIVYYIVTPEEDRQSISIMFNQK